jgi:polygalacturonase
VKIIAVFSAVLVGVSLSPGVRAEVFNVRALGAKGDGTTYDTAAIQKALDACEKSGGTVEFSAGNYLSKPLTLHSHTTVKLDAGATLWASTNQSDFMKTPGDWLKAKSSGEFMAFIGGQKLEDVTFTGSGIIDGNGAAWWPEAEKARQIKPGYTLPRPNLVALEDSKNVRVENITLQNSPKFHFVPANCEDVVISNVTILAPEHAANTDAIDPSGRRMLITKCRIDVGDEIARLKTPRTGFGLNPMCAAAASSKISATATSQCRMSRPRSPLPVFTRTIPPAMPNTRPPRMRSPVPKIFRSFGTSRSPTCGRPAKNRPE